MRSSGQKGNFVKKGLNIEVHATHLELHGALYLEHNIRVYSEKAMAEGAAQSLTYDVCDPMQVEERTDDDDKLVEVTLLQERL